MPVDIIYPSNQQIPKYIDPIMEIMERAFSEDFGEKWTRQQVIDIAQFHYYSLIIAQSKGQVIGFAILRKVHNDIEIMLIAINPHHQNKGIGTAIFRNIIKDIEHKPDSILTLEVRKNNEALNFYKKMGFKQVNIRKNYYLGAGNIRTDALTLRYQRN